MEPELKETRALLHDIVMLLDTATRNYANQLDQLQHLLQMSEQRIDRTNSMIHELSTVVCGLKDAYIHHIDQAIESRDRVLEQNTNILRRMEQTEESLRKERERYDGLMHSIVEIVAHGKSAAGTSVNIKP